jgi:HK97 family phage portal protein
MTARTPETQTMKEHKPGIIERTAEAAGRLSGAFERGKLAALGRKSFPTVNDETAWNTGRAWGAGLSALSKPYGEKIDQVEQFLSWVYVCVKLNAWSVASTPLRLYVKRGAGAKAFRTFPTRIITRLEKSWLATQGHIKAAINSGADIEEVTEHPFLDLMKNVNPVNNQSDLWEMTIMYLDLTGEGYWLLERDRLGVPVNIWVYPSQYMKVNFGETTKNLILGYTYERGAIRQPFKPEEIVYFTYPNPKNPFMGHSIVRGLCDAVFMNSELYSYEESMLKNRARTGGVLERAPDSNYSDAQVGRVKAEFEERYAGAAQAGKTIMLPAGFKYIRDAMTPEEISHIESRKITREELCAGFDVPIGALVSTDVNRANAETADYRHAKNGTRPRCVRLEQKINERIMPIYDLKLFVAFDDCVPEDKEFALRKRQMDIQTNVALINEARSEDGKEALPYGDSVWIPMELVPVDPDDDQNAEEEPRKPSIAPPSAPAAGKPDEGIPGDDAEESSETPSGESQEGGKSGKSARRHPRRNPVIERLVNEVLEDLGG